MSCIEYNPSVSFYLSNLKSQCLCPLFRARSTRTKLQLDEPKQSKQAHATGGWGWEWFDLNWELHLDSVLTRSFSLLRSPFKGQLDCPIILTTLTVAISFTSIRPSIHQVIAQHSTPISYTMLSTTALALAAVAALISSPSLVQAKIECDTSLGTFYPYCINIPDGAQSGQNFPTIVFLSGSGARGPPSRVRELVSPSYRVVSIHPSLPRHQASMQGAWGNKGNHTIYTITNKSSIA